jgi:hypothetical protein
VSSPGEVCASGLEQDTTIGMIVRSANKLSDKGHALSNRWIAARLTVTDVERIVHIGGKITLLVRACQ